MAGRVYSAGKSGPAILASLAPVLFVTGLGVSLVVVGLAGENEMGIAIAAGGHAGERPGKCWAFSRGLRLG
jgi:hypothetical protein